MSQYDFGTIDPNVKSGTQLALDLNQWRDALHTGHAGAARPSYVQPGMIWIKQVSSTVWQVMLATATTDVPLGTVDPTTSEVLNGQRQAGYGQCVFGFTSATVCTLLPRNGNLLTINGVPRPIPAAGVTLASSAMGADNTTYFVYAYWTGSAIALEVSTTTHATDTATGMRVKSGDATRTLVGMVRRAIGATFQDSTTIRYVRSWFNEGGIIAAAFHAPGTGITVNLGPYVELDSNTRVYMLTWGNAFEYLIGGSNVAGTPAANLVACAGVSMDSVNQGWNNQTIWYSSQLASVGTSIQGQIAHAEGLHYFGITGGVSTSSFVTAINGTMWIQIGTVRK